jgi:carboxymethylenebutenolidase
MKRAALLLSLAALCLPAAAQDWAQARLTKSPRHSEYVTLTSAGGRKLQAFVVYPEVKDKAPVVVMIHEIFGLTDWAREMADEVAGAGYIVVEPDLLSGLGPAGTNSSGAAFTPAQPGGTSAFPSQDAAIHAVSSLPDDRVLADLDAAADYGKSLPASNGTVFVAGFCWGGGKSFLFATHRHDLSAAFVFYGPPPAPDLMKNITAPVYGFYAGSDARITSTIPQTTAAMKADGKTYDPVVYDGAGHGFMRAGEAPDANAANTAARQEGFRRFVKLLGGVH